MRKKTEPKRKVGKKIRKGNKVVAIAGNFRGMSGVVLSCTGERVIVQGLNVRKRHMKGQQDRPGQIVSIERPIHVSNLCPCAEDETPLKLKTRTTPQGERELYYVEGDRDVRYRSLKKPIT